MPFLPELVSNPLTGGVCPDSIWQSIEWMIQHFPMKLCGGLIYSGHTCYFSICVSPPSPVPDNFVAGFDLGSIWCLCQRACGCLACLGCSERVCLFQRLSFRVSDGACRGMYALLSCRYHYVVDLVLALAIVLLAWHLQEAAQALSALWARGDTDLKPLAPSRTSEQPQTSLLLRLLASLDSPAQAMLRHSQ
jgi:hypothetical protein